MYLICHFGFVLDSVKNRKMLSSACQTCVGVFDSVCPQVSYMFPTLPHNKVKKKCDFVFPLETISTSYFFTEMSVRLSMKKHEPQIFHGS